MYSIVLSIEKLKGILSGCLADDKFQQDISGKDLKRMIETIRLFDEDSHQTLFEGCVLSCEQDGDLYKITLNQTMFFPEEGGQSCDRGTLNDIPVEKVLEKDRVIAVGRRYGYRLCRLGEAFLRYAAAYGGAYCIRTYS